MSHSLFTWAGHCTILAHKNLYYPFWRRLSTARYASREINKTNKIRI